MPCYNDWPSIFELLDNIDEEILELKGEFSVLIVNDGSNEKMPESKRVYKHIKSVEVINMKKNQGHTRSNATGIRYLSKKENFDFLILMDGDGEDRPEKLVNLAGRAFTNTAAISTRPRKSNSFEAVMEIGSPQVQRSRDQHSREQLFTKNIHRPPEDELIQGWRSAVKGGRTEFSRVGMGRARCWRSDPSPPPTST